MKIAVLGVGGVGGVYGAALAQSGHDVVFIARGQHLDAMQSKGLQIIGKRNIHIYPINVTDNSSEEAPVDCVVLAVKLHATEEAATSLSPLISKDTAVLSLQNGIDAEQTLAEKIGSKHVMGGTAEISASIKEPGIIKLVSDYTRITFGELNEDKSARGEALEAALIDAGIEAKFTTDIDKALWKKFMFLVPISGLTSITRSTFGDIREDPVIRDYLEQCVQEVISVAKAKGINIDPDSFEKCMKLIEALPADGRASMAVDLENGKRLELPWLNGAVDRLGKKLGVPTPVNSFINAALKIHQNGKDQTI